MTNLGCPLVPNAPCELDKITHMWHQITHGGIQSRQSKSHMVAGLQWNVSKKSISHPEAALQYIYIYLDLQTPNIFWPFWLFTNYGWNRLVFLGSSSKTETPKNHANWIILNVSNIFLPSPTHVSSNFWGCQSSALELFMQVWLRNPTYFFCAKHFGTESAKNKKHQNAPQTSRKNPQNARKNPQTPANPESWVFSLCLHIAASSVVVFERHRDKK